MSDTTKNRAHGAPTKDFFIRMITRDISLRDCILDLLDNAVDGARRTKAPSEDAHTPLKGFEATVKVSSESFEITDNCGLDPVWWTSSERWVRCPQWQKHKAGERAGGSRMNLSSRLSA